MSRTTFAAAVVALAFAKPAFAEEPRDPAAAETLFQQALEAFEAGRTPEACSKFAESMRLDPANGTLINLARCHEREGKIATAWSEYNDAAALSRRAGQPDRAAVAEEAAKRLEPLLPRLKIVAREQAPDLAISRGGVRLGRAAFGEPLPIDAGMHRVVATAVGKIPFATTITIAAEPKVTELVIPELETAPAPAVPSPSPFTPNDAPAGDRPLLIAGAVVGGVGVAALISGAVLGAMSLSELGAAEDDASLCPGQVCSPAGREAVDAAAAKGDASTGLFVAGGVLAATGLLLIGVDLGREQPGAIAFVPRLGPFGAGGTATIRF